MPLKRRGFSLLEMILSTVMLGLLTGMLFIAFRDGTRAFNNLNLRQGRFSFRGGFDFLRDHALSLSLIAACLLGGL